MLIFNYAVEGKTEHLTEPPAPTRLFWDSELVSRRISKDTCKQRKSPKWCVSFVSFACHWHTIGVPKKHPLRLRGALWWPPAHIPCVSFACRQGPIPKVFSENPAVVFLAQGYQGKPWSSSSGYDHGWERKGDGYSYQMGECRLYDFSFLGWF